MISSSCLQSLRHREDKWDSERKKEAAANVRHIARLRHVSDFTLGVSQLERADRDMNLNSFTVEKIERESCPLEKGFVAAYGIDQSCM